MKRIIGILLLALAAQAHTAAAQTVQVRTGEHGAFTRMALDLPANTSWRVEQAPEVVRILLDGGPFDYDLRRAFSRIDRARIGNITPAPDQSGLLVNLACDCGVSTFMQGSRMLVLDIAALAAGQQADGTQTGLTGPDLGVTEYRPDADFARLGLFEQAAPVGVTEEFGAPQIAFVPRETRSESVTLPVVENDPVDAASMGRAASSDGDTSDPTPDIVTETDLAGPAAAIDGAALRAALRDGALSGVLESAGAVERMEPDATAPLPDEAIASGGPMAGQTQTRTSSGLQIAHDACAPPEDLLPAAAASPGLDAMIATRGTVFTEFDSVQPDALLAHQYDLLSLGFGAEARALFDLAPAHEAPIVRALSYLVDGESDPARYFSDQYACDGQAAVWALLTRIDDPAIPMVDAENIVRAGMTLPPALRRHLGPRITTALHRAGHTASAEDLLAQLERAYGTDPNGIAFAEASIALQSGDAYAANAALDRVSLSQPSDRNALVLARIDAAFALDQPVAQDTLDIAELAFAERRQTPQGALFWRGYVRALLTVGAFDEAVRIYGQIPPDTRISALDETRRDLAARLVRDASDSTFLKHILTERTPSLQPVEPALIRAVADRLLALGLADSALAQLDRLPGEPTVGADTAGAEQGRLLRARALLTLGRLEEAEDALSSATSIEARRLIAELRERQGRYGDAQATYSALAEADRAARAAWLDGSWDALSRSDGVFADVATLATTGPGALADSARADPALSTLETLVEGSASARSTLDALLGETALDEF